LQLRRGGHSDLPSVSWSYGAFKITNIARSSQR
jgi:hypothetical protein